MERRYIKDSIDSDLANRMVFIGGPRQVGKTTLALSLLDRGQDESSPAYLNWDVLADRGARFENMVAGHLLKYCHYVEDTQGHEMELRFIRDTDKREVDFVVLRDGRAEFAVECKSGEQSAAPVCRYFRERTDIPRFYQVHLGTKNFGNAAANTRVLPFSTFCREVGLP